MLLKVTPKVAAHVFLPISQ